MSPGQKNMNKTINKYELKAPLQNHNAGFSRWTIASRASHLFFLKEFLNPKYPDDHTLQEDLRMTRIRECAQYEREKARLYAAVNEASDGNLVRIIEFFRENSHYYITTRWVESMTMSFQDIARLDMKDKLLLCRTAAHSIAALHDKGIVHADIKDTNVLVHKTREGLLVTKIVDFDSSFFEGMSPEDEEDLGGDQVYLSPEACLFFCGEEVRLTCKMDVFALGLLFHQFLTGELPYFDGSSYDYAHEAVLDDFVLRVDSPYIPIPVRTIIEHMLLKDAERRISARETYFLLTAFYNQAFAVSPPLPCTLPKTEVISPAPKKGSDFFRIAGDL